NAIVLGGAGATRTLSGSGISLSGVTGSGKNLRISDTGTTILTGTVAGINDLTADSGGITDLRTDVSTTGVQDYQGDTVTIANSTAGVTLSGSILTFANVTGGAGKALIVNPGSGGFATFLNSPTALDSLTIGTSGTTVLFADVTTTNGQNYQNSLTLSGAGTRALSGSTLTFGVVDGNTRGLATTSTGATTFGGGVTNLASLTTTGPVNLNTDVTTAGAQTHNGALTLGGAGATRTLGGSTFSALSSIAGGGKNLTITSPGAVILTGPITGVNTLSINGGGTTAINQDIATTGGQSYGPVMFGGAGATRTLTATDLTLGVADGGGKNLVFNASGATTLGGAITNAASLTTDGPGSTVLDGDVTTTGAQIFGDATSLSSVRALSASAVTFGSGLTGSGLARLTTTTGAAGTTFNGPVSGLDTLSVGAATLNAASMSAGTTQTYAGPVSLGTDVTFGGGDVTFTSAAPITGNGRSLTFNNIGFTGLGAPVAGVNALTSGNSGAMTFGASVAAGSIAVNIPMTLSGATVTTTGAQAFAGAVSLGADTTLTGSSVAITGPVTGNGRSLGLASPGLKHLRRVNGAGAITLTGGGSNALVDAITASSLNVADATTIGSPTATITTTGAQNYAGVLALGFDAVLNGSGVTLAGVAGGGRSLTINSAGTTAFNGPVSGVTNLTTDAAGGTTLGTSVLAASGVITFNDPVSLTTDTTITATGGITFGSTLNGAGRALTLNSQGVTSVVGAASGLGSLTTDAGGSTSIGSPNLSTTGDLTINDALALTTDTTLAGANVTLAGPVTGNGRGLTINTPGATVLGAISGAGAVATDAPGTTSFNGPVNVASLAVGDDATLGTASVTTTGAQTFSKSLTLGSDATLTASGLTVTGAILGGGRSLTINDSGATSLGSVSGVEALTTDAAGTTTLRGTVAAGSVAIGDAAQLNGGSVTTTGDQTYSGAVGLGADTTLSGANLTAAGGLSGNAKSLTANSSGVTRIGRVSRVTTLTTDAGGSTTLSGNVDADTVTLNDAATLDADTLSTARDLTLAAGLSLARDTTLASGGIPLADGSALPAGTASAVTIGGPIAGNGKSLRLISTGAASLGAVGGVKSLSTDASGTTVLNGAVSAESIALGNDATLAGGSITTTGAQTYAGKLSLAADTTLDGASVAALKSINSATAASLRKLTIRAAGPKALSGSIGDVNPLSELISTGGGTDTFTGTTINTSGPITFNDPLILTADTTINDGSGSGVFFNSTIDSLDSTPRALTVNSGAVTRFSGRVGATNPIASLITDAPGSTEINVSTSNPSATINATGPVVFNDPVSLGGANGETSITAGRVTFAGRVDAASATALRALRIRTNGGGSTTLGAAVGDVNPLDRLDIDADAGSSTTIASNVTTYGGAAFNNPVLISGNSTISARPAATEIPESSRGRLFFGSTIDAAPGAASSTLSLDSTVFGESGRPAAITFRDSIGASAPLTGLNLRARSDLPPDRVASVSPVSTIAMSEGASPNGGFSTSAINPLRAYRIRTTGPVIMGQGEKILVTGDLTIDAPSVQLGDVTSLGSITVNSPDISLVSRAPADVLLPSGGRFLDNGLDIIANRSITFSSAPKLLGTRGPASFSNPNGDGDTTGNLSGYLFRAFGSPITINNIQASDGLAAAFDLEASGISNTNVSEAIAGASRVERFEVGSAQTTLGGAAKKYLEQIGIFTRDLSPAETLDFLVGRALYNDVPRPGDDPRVSPARLPLDLTLGVIDSYVKLFKKQAVDENGKPLTEADGSARLEDRVEEIQTNLDAAIADYRKSVGKDEGAIDCDELRAYLKSNPSAERDMALRDLEGLANLLRQVDLLGLSPLETRTARNKVLLNVLPESLSREEFEALVTGCLPQTGAPRPVPAPAPAPGKS
ncbi:MAG: hypothetical protein JNM07_09175, partial [Phycisphaerae bacterium]|nr:hypothetical protein [Phycisphaerae bacterium]